MICSNFRLSNFKNTLNPLNLNYLLVHHQAFDELSECFHKHITQLISSYTELDSEYPQIEELTKDDRDQLINDISYIREKDRSQIRVFLKGYMNEAQMIYPEIFGKYSLDTEVDSAYTTTIFLELLDSYRDDDLEDFEPSHFFINYKYSRKIENLGHLLMTPIFNLFYDFIHNTYHIELMEDYLKEILVTDDPLTLDETYSRLSKYGVAVSKEFFIHFLLNNPHFLFIDKDKIEVVEEVFPSFHLLACTNNPLNYVRIENYDFKTAEYEKFNYELDANYLKKYFTKFNETRFLNSISFDELVFKLRIYRRLDHKKVQGIPEEIHTKIVELLVQKQTVLTHQQICNFLQCEDIPLRVFKLPTGRILAYGMKNKKFLEKDTSSYILSDWVKSNEQDRKKIHPSRVLTPLKQRKIIVDERVIKNLVEKNECYQQTKIIDVEKLYQQFIWDEFQVREIEYFYEYQSLSIIKDILAELYVYLGNDLYIDLNDLDFDFTSNNLRSCRKETLSYITNNALDYRNYIQSHYPTHFNSLLKLLK